MKYLLTILLLFFPAILLADGIETSDALPSDDTARQSATHDLRLPPVLPGEEVERGGKRMRVWSSAGAVDASPPPTPGQRLTPPLAPTTALSSPTLDGLGVIVDRRDK